MKTLIKKLIQQRNLTRPQLDELKNSWSRLNYRNAPSTAEVLKEYRRLVAHKKISPSAPLEAILQKRAVRTLSGVAIVTVLTKPWPCPGRCVYCPLEPDMPKSYLKSEPAAQRAYFNKFNPYNQVISRLQMLYNNGHPTDKIELIVKGGSWNSYQWKYQVWFIKECFRACNDFQSNKKHENQNLAKTQKLNETAAHRLIGLTLETRPDLITHQTAEQMRVLGCTRVEMGIQHTDNKILQLTKRGHTIEDAKKATALLRYYGFKIDFHLMPQLPGSTPAKDCKMFEKNFADPDLRPDMIKIYPCTVVKNSELYQWHKKGKFKPYTDKKLIEMLVKVKSKIIPRYCRISRLIRDIPSTEIVAGNKITNLRQTIQKEMKKHGLKCQCLRCREIGHQEKIKNKIPKLFIDKYSTSGGTEYFLSFEDTKRRAVYAFCRLRLGADGLYPAFIRELHTYGHLMPLGQKSKKASQHQGLGKKLIAKAEKIASKSGADTIAVISGIGVRGYYKKLGYKIRETYMVKKLPRQNRRGKT
ncbi:MAG: Histone acetyltransferase, ELP3 family [Candidatus Magasanikbacteria bacterium GW2011_GWC2_41_17]|uniref:tRNA carboxymethyluridine synthase n=2 Tax=Candidatus Magasanikiibacteriota TaxID=1752731 RepID=A0A0G0YGR8_9BACT|nr:MAG: Histone acetyltransferase, ELP3 family [Candidatus Magasanikbacteria bacterium GW2011_GWC2_41_17]HBX15972.1 tRNA uridine(34) 5-carboxymethylaminomethyl modification radical SAM/GNAT enzyme Elp3 [Candidatus Magasanikbacteria bacterium]